MWTLSIQFQNVLELIWQKVLIFYSQAVKLEFILLYLTNKKYKLTDEDVSMNGNKIINYMLAIT